MHPFCAVLIAMCCLHGVYGQVRVKTPVGEILGETKNTDSGRVDVFLGIPYAKPPIEQLRFSKPEKPANFEYPFFANLTRPMCVQVMAASSIWLNLPISRRSDEDCLYLNIYVPKGATKTPVMVFLDGDNFQRGRSDIYEAENLAAKGGIVVVTLNYRLGFLGFFTTGKSSAPGNLGLWDQNLALQWVKDNIEPFGGEPSEVTLVGWSGGATSAALHTLSEKSKGLFNRLILQAGAARGPAIISTPERVLEYSIAVGDYLRCYLKDNPDPLSEMVTCLRGVQNNPTILRVVGVLISREDNVRGLLKSVWVPIIDGDFIKDDPVKLMADGDYLESIGFYDLDILLGTTLNDGSILEYLLTSFLRTDDMITVMQPTGLDSKFARETLYPALVEARLGRQSSAGREYLEEIYPLGDKTTPYQVIFSSLTDSLFVTPVLEFARAHSRGNTDRGKTFMYMFDYSAAAAGRVGVPHGSELPYVFGLSNLVSKASSMPSKISDEDKTLSDLVIGYWSNFIKTGNPNSPKALPVPWPEYTDGTQEYFRITLSGGSVGEKNLESDNIAFWTNCFPGGPNGVGPDCPTYAALMRSTTPTTKPTSPKPTTKTTQSTPSKETKKTDPTKPTTKSDGRSSEPTKEPQTPPTAGTDGPAPVTDPPRRTTAKKPFVIVDNGNVGCKTTPPISAYSLILVATGCISALYLRLTTGQH